MQSSSQIITINKPIPNVLQARCPSCHPVNSVRGFMGKKANSRTVIEFRRYTLNANMWPSNFWRILMSVWFQNYDSQNEHSGSQNFCGRVRDKIILAVFNSSQHVLTTTYIDCTLRFCYVYSVNVFLKNCSKIPAPWMASFGLYSPFLGC